MLRYVISFIGVTVCVFLWSCANQTTPAGGPKDEDPPRLLSSSPVHKQKNFKKKEITLEFNEFVALNNPKDEILISPSVGKKIDFIAKKTKVTIQPEEGWNDSTTYSISFREGIRDATENNAPENLKIAFSTGPTIDSLEIRGKVKFALNEKVPEKITIAIYKADTFDIFKHTPSYFTISNKNGAFSIENIKSGLYHIYAFGDNNKNLKVESRNEKFGFISKPIELNGKIDSLTIPLISLDTREIKINSVRNNGLFTTIRFNKYIKDYQLEHSTPDQVANSYGVDQTEVILYNPTNILDSIEFKITGIDSLEASADTIFYVKTMENRAQFEAFKVSTSPIRYDIETSTINTTINLSKPLLAITSDSIFVRIDSLTLLPFQTKFLQYDTIHKKIEISIPILVDSVFKEGEKPQLIFAHSSFISIELDSSKATTLPLTKTKSEDTGILLIEVETKKESFVVQLLNNNNQVVDTMRNQTKYAFKNLLAQDYKLRVIIDRNNNGIWDVGNILVSTEPEPTYYYKTLDNSYSFPIRANWELGPLLLKF